MAPRPSADLNGVVEVEVIPRLLVAHRVAALDKIAPEDGLDRLISPKTLARRIFLEAPAVHVAQCRRLLNVGLSPEAVYRDLLAPTASLMSELWDRDELSFVDATIGLGRLRTVIRELGWMTPYNGDDEITPRTALFMPCPGEELTFGFHLTEESFRWSGWRTIAEAIATAEELVEAVQRRWFDFVCLSLNRAEDIEEATLAIAAIRRSSRNEDIFVLIDGRGSDDDSDLATVVGAHASACGRRSALQIADKAVWPPTKA